MNNSPPLQTLIIAGFFCLLLSACNSPEPALPTQPLLTPTISTPSPEPPTSSPTSAATITPSPTSPPIATNTPTILPSPTLAAMLPIDEMRHQYWEEILPLANELLQAPPVPEGYPLPAPEESQIVLVPLSERLHYLQANLYPQEPLGENSTLPTQYYVLYNYQRGAELATTENAYYAVTQDMSVDLLVVVRQGEDIYLVESPSNTAGVGASSIEDMVYSSIPSLETLGDSGRDVTIALQSILASATGLSQQVPILLYALSSPYWSDRQEAANSLGKIGVAPRPEVISALLWVLNDDRFQVNDMALRSLWNLKPEMLPPWQSISDIGFVPTGPLTFLELCNGEAYHDILREYLTDEMWERRALAARMLQWAGSTEDIPALIEALEDAHPTVRAMAMRALGGLIDDPGLITVVLTAHQDPNISVRVAAIEALKNQILWLTDEAFPTLVEALNHSDAEVRLAAATVLMAKTGWDCELVSTASPALVAALNDDSEAVRQMAQQTLDRLAMFCP